MQPVLIVAHGQPSNPGPAAAELAHFAAAVARLLPGHEVASVTLAEAGGLDAAFLRRQDGGWVFPMFMAGGWFARTHLPAKLREAGAVGWQVLEPFGCDPALHDLAAVVVDEVLGGAVAGELLLAAHGSFKTSVPSDVAFHVAARIGAKLGLARAEVAFIDQAPQLSQVRGFSDHAICLPFFAAAGRHVAEDIPMALAAAGFKGRILPALGQDRRVPALAAAAIRRAEPVCALSCRFNRNGRPGAPRADQTV